MGLNLGTLKEELVIDEKLDISNIQTAAYQLPIKLGKWSRHRASIKSEIVKCQRDLEHLTAEKYKFYLGKHPDAVCDTIYEIREMKYILDGDHEILKCSVLLHHCKNVLSFIEDAMKVLNTQGFVIRNIIDDRKMQAGIV